MKINIKQILNHADEAKIDHLDNLVIILPYRPNLAAWPVFPYANRLKTHIRRQDKKDCLTTQVLDLPNTSGTRTSFVAIKEDISAFELLTLARKLVEPHLTANTKQIGLCLPDLKPDLANKAAQALVAAAGAGSFAMPSLKSEPSPSNKLEKLIIFYPEQKFTFKRTLAEIDGNNLARYLTALPPNELTPGKYRQRIEKLAHEQNWQMEFFDTKALRRKKAGAFLAVAQGSAEQDAGIVLLQYRPGKAHQNAFLSLVGKGICFDTGGTNLKPARHMHGMHEDMQGSAVALGTFLTLSQLKVKFSMDCWLALAQNHIGPNAYKQNDVVTASNGTTIEIVHTDAEGRMVLADTLAFASRKKPKLIIDYATLTGSCIDALGTVYSGALTNRMEWIADIISAGQDSGERVWPFPNDVDYDDELTSSVADIKQCTLGSGADHILAARFLNRFISTNVPWIHIDLAAGNHKGGLAHIPTDITGFGIRFTLNLLLDRKIL